MAMGSRRPNTFSTYIHRSAAAMCEAMMAPFLLMGALEVVQRPPRHQWPLIVGLGVGLLRGAHTLPGRDHPGRQVGADRAGPVDPGLVAALVVGPQAVRGEALQPRERLVLTGWP